MFVLFRFVTVQVKMKNEKWSIDIEPMKRWEKLFAFVFFSSIYLFMKSSYHHYDQIIIILLNSEFAEVSSNQQ